jgi:hypothetical protein
MAENDYYIRTDDGNDPEMQPTPARGRVLLLADGDVAYDKESVQGTGRLGLGRSPDEAVRSARHVGA